MTMPAIDETLLPGPEDVVFYREHGWWISPVILPPEVLDAAERGMARYYAGDLDTSGDGWTAPPAEGLRKHDYASLHVRELARLVAQPLVAATAARLAGADSTGDLSSPVALGTEHRGISVAAGAAGPAGGSPVSRG